MNDLQYAYAVGRVRVKELSLLTDADFERLLTAGQERERAAILAAKGYVTEGLSRDEMLARRHADACVFLDEVLPDRSVMNCLFIDNDFHAVKTALRDGMTGKDSSSLLLKPAVFDEKEIYRLTLAREFDALPPELSGPARDACDVLTRTGAAFPADSALDKACAALRVAYAKKSRSKMLLDYAVRRADLDSVKAVLRCLRAGKNRAAMTDCCAGCGSLRPDALIAAALQGEEAFLRYLDGTDLEPQAQALRVSDAAFEKSCDDALTEITQAGKRSAFGVEPIAAYYLAVGSELRTVRVILAAVNAGYAPDTIRERIRQSYV